MHVNSIANTFIGLLFLGTLCVQVSQAQSYTTPPPPRPITQSGSNSESTATATTAPATNGRLQVTAPSDSAPATPPSSPYVVQAAVRDPQSGYSVSAYTGMSVAQEDDLNGSTVGATTVNTDQSLMPLAGIKFGYVWPFGEEPIDQFMNETKTGVKLSGGLETEAFYLRNETELNAAGAQVGKVESNMFNLMINATLQAQWNKFRLYAGPGIGMSVIDSDVKLTGFSTESETQARLAYQVIGGLDYFFHPQWSAFGEYKYFIIDNFKVSNSGATADFDQLGQHLLTVGVRRHF